jgi:hypothetical protein
MSFNKYTKPVDFTIPAAAGGQNGIKILNFPGNMLSCLDTTALFTVTINNGRSEMRFKTGVTFNELEEYNEIVCINKTGSEITATLQVGFVRYLDSNTQEFELVGTSDINIASDAAGLALEATQAAMAANVEDIEDELLIQGSDISDTKTAAESIDTKVSSAITELQSLVAQCLFFYEPDSYTKNVGDAASKWVLPAAMTKHGIICKPTFGASVTSVDVKVTASFDDIDYYDLGTITLTSDGTTILTNYVDELARNVKVEVINEVGGTGTSVKIDYAGSR